MPQNMYCISSATENNIMEVPQKIPISAFSATLAYNGISITIFFKAPALVHIFYDTWSEDIFLGTSSTLIQVITACETTHSKEEEKKNKKKK